VTVQPQFEGGAMLLPSGPGWGTDINEDVLREHPWPARRDLKSEG
jgi:L-alanine-DL-glutamate epimerase-like enolase superfamily enzyme